MSCWLGLSARPAATFRLFSVVDSNRVVLCRWREAVSGLTPGESWTLGSAAPPLFTITFAGPWAGWAIGFFLRRCFFAVVLEAVAALAFGGCVDGVVGFASVVGGKAAGWV